MSFGRFPGFDEDPFFSRGMQPFSMGFPAFPMLGFGHHDPSARRRQDDQGLAMMNPFSMFNNMDRMMNQAMTFSGGSGGSGNGGAGHYHSSSTVMHYSNTGDGNPTVYHATSSTTKGPGEVKETIKSESDSRTGVKKMAIGHHIGERSHTIEKRENRKTSDRQEHQEFVNLDDTEAGDFDHEWQQKSRSFRQQPHVKSREQDHFANRRGLEGSMPETGSYRDHRSRSPEKRKHSDTHLAPRPSHPEASRRRREYVQEEDRPSRKVRF